MVTNTTTLTADPINCFIQGLIETIGPEEFEKLVQHFTGSKTKFNKNVIDEIQPVYEKLNEVYGTTSASGIAICSGRAAFKHLLWQQGSELGFDHDSFRFSTGQAKYKKGLTLLAKWMKSTFNEKVEIENNEHFWLFNVTPSSMDETSGKQNSMCDFTIGLLQEFMSWAGGGKYYMIHEIACCSAGSGICSFKISKTPVE